MGVLGGRDYTHVDPALKLCLHAHHCDLDGARARLHMSWNKRLGFQGLGIRVKELGNEMQGVGFGARGLGLGV